ncbi:MAG TPA: hypothetical protein VFL16_17550 [Steroidobacteraceae bacterium]|nr:hypothetical protein [Steroidobacteraceae bacterium]
MDGSRRRLLAPVLAAGLWIFASMSFRLAAAPLDQVPTMDVVRSKLELTPEQESQLAPLFAQRMEQLQQARSRLESAASKSDKRAILRESKHAQTDFNAKVEKVLTPTQVGKWRELRAQTREKLKERYEDRRDSH